MKEYKTPKIWLILIYIFAPALIILFCFLLIMPFIPSMRGDMSPSAFWFLGPLSIAMIGLMVAGLIDAHKGKFVIDHDRIYTIGVLGTRELMLDEIKGYTINDKYIFVEPNIKGKKRIKISTYIGKTNEIVGWLSTHYPDLDQVSAQKEEVEILNNEEFGWTTEQREQKLKRARMVAKVLNIVGGVTFAWIWLWPKLYMYCIVAGIIVPIAALAALKLSGGLIRLNEKKGSAYPSVLVAFLLPSLGLMIRSVLDFNIFSYGNLWKITLVLALGISIVLWMGNKEFQIKVAKDYAKLLLIPLMSLLYAFGFIVEVNCLFDYSESEVYTAKILDKSVSTGKTTVYHFELEPWGPSKEADKVTVTEDLYNQLNVDDEATIYFQKGLFQIPWFMISD